MNNPDSPDDRIVWERLRDSMERLEASRQQASNPAALMVKLTHRAKLLRGRTSLTVDEPRTTYVTFSSGHERFGVLLRDVIEIQGLDHYSPVPRTPPYIVGVIPWRGGLLTLFDLGRLFRIREAGIADYHVCIVVEAAGRRIAIVAREVEDIVGLTADQVKMAPDIPGHAPVEWIAGVYDGNRILLHLERLLAAETIVNWKGATRC